MVVTMDSTGGCGPGDGEERKPDLSTRQDHPVATAAAAAPTPTPTSAAKLAKVSSFDKEPSKNSDKLLTAVNRWSQEENSAVTPGESSQVFKLPHSLPLANGVTAATAAAAAVNGVYKPSAGHPAQAVGFKLAGGRHSEQSLLNNNLIEDKCNLRCNDEKSYCMYHKFPTKVNNNVYPEKASSVKDGMDEYFQMNASVISSKHSSQPPQQQQQAKCNELSPSRDASKYPDHLNLLNGEEEDEDDGCIYTYKGENFEANLSHLIDMCLSCGLPNTERGGDGRDAIVHRLMNGSPRADPPEQNNLFSPEMDFLEMDFDPGPNGDGDADSDCEDNCVDECDSRLVIDHNAAFSVAGALNPISRKTNNYCSEMRNLMCKRCESSICDGKIDNVALNLRLHENSSPLNFGRGPNDGLDDRPNVGNGVLNVPRDTMNVPKDLNVALNQFSGSHCRLSSQSVSLVPDDDNDPQDNDSIENNLGEADDMDMIDDEDGEDADDEDGDDSNSDMPELSERLPACNGSSEFVLRDESSCHVHCSAKKSINKQSNKSANNNLGSVSAPEVSPAKEYSPLEKFGRSISFHNQLSSPKYENVCFTRRSPKSGDENPCQAAGSTRKSAADREGANLEICAGRLNSRENSVFNILSDPNAGSSQSLNSVFDTTKESSAGMLGKHSSVVSLPSATATSTGHSSVLLTSPALSSPMRTGARSPPVTLSGTSSAPCPLPVKSLRPKNTNPSQDPNTASEGEGGGDESCPRVKKVMIWTELQASGRQVTQIATSACGATAIINVLLALDYPHTLEEVQNSIKTRLRAELAPVVDYLLSRSVAGTTHKDLIEGVTLLSKGSIKAKFFHMFPKRAVQLSRWLAQWIGRGGVPLATLNLQVGVAVGQTIPDAWHHQMIFGVGPQGIYLTNPLECVSDCLLGEQLCTDSVLLVRRADIVSRWGQGDKLIRLTKQKDPRWLDMNVLGQVLGVLKEQAAPPIMQGRRHLTSHVAIPAAYQSGVTIFMRADNSEIHTLLEAEELPLLE
ncbi:LOW QUALITY PROTEIN: uncharacterized protein LOC135194958 [Macrobrachium nipponense]|uniref:LOW QUALITY PROTEIN: uncharacterized protein LOC135194958 n=1 Tax=Macrobrachium nipponense TaxID=159736 RepID=UPI0030C84F22